MNNNISRLYYYMFIEIVSKLFSEALLSLYPVFVKNINIPLYLQLWSRFITYIMITSFFVDWGFIAKYMFSKNGILLSLVTIAHVYTSYRGFQLLESGVAYSLFYTYPLMILLLAGEPITLFMILAIVGVILIANDSKSSPPPPQDDENIFSRETTEEFRSINDSSIIEKYEGYFMIALAAFTEAIIYFIVRELKTPNNWNHMFLSYFAGTFLFSFIGFKDIAKITFTSVLSLSLLINAIIGLCGYLLRFYATTRLPPSIYAPLSYVGIIMAYIYGFIFNNEQITIQKIIGTICILVAIVH